MLSLAWLFLAILLLQPLSAEVGRCHHIQFMSSWTLCSDSHTVKPVLCVVPGRPCAHRILLDPGSAHRVVDLKENLQANEYLLDPKNCCPW